MDETAKIALNRVWTLVAGVLSALAALPGLSGACLPGPVWARAFAELRFAEAAARRALFVMAKAQPGPRLPCPSTLPPARVERPDVSPPLSPKIRADRAPLFQLSDTLPDPLVLAGVVEARAPAGPIVASGAPRPAAGLRARIAALQAVLDDPGPALARFIARRDRPRRHIFDRGTAPRLRTGYPPGFIVRRALEWSMDVLMEIHMLARGRGADPPLAPETLDPRPAA
ncbi:MAG: hypothetical protein AAGI03_02815 [Pseudomonadota bacterium]